MSGPRSLEPEWDFPLVTAVLEVFPSPGVLSSSRSYRAQNEAPWRVSIYPLAYEIAAISCRSMCCLAKSNARKCLCGRVAPPSSSLFLGQMVLLTARLGRSGTSARYRQQNQQPGDPAAPTKPKNSKQRGPSDFARVSLDLLLGAFVDIA